MTAFCGLFALLTSGGINLFFGTIFAFIFLIAWRIEDSEKQISERLSLILILVFLPIFYLDWRYQLGSSAREVAMASSLAKMILTLTAIKLLQKKSNRDWFFIYLTSFFQVLLSAGFSISPLFILSLLIYLFFIICAIICFEIRKMTLISKAVSSFEGKSHYRLFAVAAALLFSTVFLSVPLFFTLPRVGGAGFGANLGGGLTTGFSDSIRLGQIARIQQSNDVVMRVRVDRQVPDIKWRAMALDYFDNISWYRTRRNYTEPFIKTEQDFFVVDGATEASNLISQTVYLEPLDTPVLFSLWRPVAFQGPFKLINKDAEGAVSVARVGSERFSYKVLSDISAPSIERLRSDDSQYSFSHYRYLQLPDRIDPRIVSLAEEIISKANATNRYDKARAIERYLQENFGYTLDLKAGGSEPLADFLFNVREGHCEYFASAMAVMLRTQGIATRIATGFQSGEYNETADVYIVRQKHAHAWVEVYFPRENAWIAFDPTPAAGRQMPSLDQTNIVLEFSRYLEALEALWIQYVVSYDSQEQKSLMSNFYTQIRKARQFLSEKAKTIVGLLSQWWQDLIGQRGIKASLIAIIKAVSLLGLTLLAIWFFSVIYRKLRFSELLLKLKSKLSNAKTDCDVEFYSKMVKILERNGLKREFSQTPMEFALAIGFLEAKKITEKYNEVRFGKRKLSESEKRQIEKWLQVLEFEISKKSKTE